MRPFLTSLFQFLSLSVYAALPMARRERPRRRPPFIPLDQEAFDRLPPLVQRAIMRHRFDFQRTATVIEKLLEGQSQQRIAEIQADIFRAAFGSVSANDKEEDTQ